MGNRGQAACRRCDLQLRLAGCGCWVDDRGTRWCADGKSLHDPAGSAQPKRCGSPEVMTRAERDAHEQGGRDTRA